MFSDPWLNRWISLIGKRSAGAPVLEIGCGHGDDTVNLSGAGLKVVAFDLSPLCVAAARLRAPRAQIEVKDVRTQFPADARGIGVVVASLSLHYFSWSETIEIVHKIRACLRVGGILLCRVNSTEDRNFGAGKGREIEKNFYEVNGQTKRFFDLASLDDLFGEGWCQMSKEHMSSLKYLKQKALWELVLEKK